MERESLYQIVPKLKKEGLTQCQIAKIVGISQPRVSQILNKPVKEVPKWGGHLRSRLSTTQKQELISYLEAGAEGIGFEGDIWNSKRVKQLIKEKFNIDYHVDYMPDLLRTLGFSRQKPQVTDYRKNEQKVNQYLQETLPNLKKKQHWKIG